MSLSTCGIKTNQQGRELIKHGSALFPMACYDDDLSLEVVPWHWHDELEAVVITEGSAILSVAAEKFIIRQGEGFFINAGVLHAAQDFGDSKCHLHSLVFHPRLVGGSLDSIFWQNYIQPLLQDPLLKCVCLDGSVSWHQEIIKSIESTWQSAVTGNAGYEFQVRHSLSQVIFHLNNNHSVIRSHPSAKELRDAERIKIMLQYIQDHYMEDLNTSKIAESSMVSESECLRCFHNTIGTPPIQYLKQFRIQKAAILLLTTVKKIGDIGAECGFQDISYFIKSFRQMKGCSPNQYRQQNNQ